MEVLVFELGVLSPAEAAAMPIRHLDYWAERAQSHIEAMTRGAEDRRSDRELMKDYHGRTGR